MTRLDVKHPLELEDGDDLRGVPGGGAYRLGGGLVDAGARAGVLAGAVGPRARRAPAPAARTGRPRQARTAEHGFHFQSLREMFVQVYHGRRAPASRLSTATGAWREIPLANFSKARRVETGDEQRSIKEGLGEDFR